MGIYTMPILKLKGKEYEVQRSTRPDKKLMVKCDGKTIHFGQRNARSWGNAPFASLLPESEKHYDEERRKRYLARATKIKKKDGSLAIDDKCSANYFAVFGLW